MTYIAIDLDGNPLQARKYTPVTSEDKRLEEHASTLRNLRKEFLPRPLVSPSNRDFRFVE